MALLCYSLANAQTALEFNGTNNKVTTTIDADLQAMPRTTWSAWIKPHGQLTTWQMFLSMEDGGWDRFIAIEANSLGLSMGMTSDRWQTGASVTPGSWQHVVAIYDNGAMRFYYNGNEYTTNLTEGNHSSSGKFTIGANQAHSNHNHYKGQIDEVAVWNEALTSAEITALYNSGAGLDASSNSGNYTSSSNLVGYFKMDEGSGTQITDSSGSGSSGNLINMDNANWVASPILSNNAPCLLYTSPSPRDRG